MSPRTLGRPAEILLVEDNPGDVELTQEALGVAGVSAHLNVVHDGMEALAYLHREEKYAQALRPDLILLDLNLPKKDGREVLAAIKADANLKLIPVLILTTSEAEEDVRSSYQLNANSYIIKPVNFAGFARIARAIDGFWFSVVTYPSVGSGDAAALQGPADRGSSG
jgi:CheY-like chemotaxis protein